MRLSLFVLPVGAHATLLDHVHRPRGIAFAHDDLAGRNLDSLELRDEDRERLVRELGEARWTRKKFQSDRVSASVWNAWRTSGCERVNAVKTELPRRSACTGPLARTVATRIVSPSSSHLAEAVAPPEHVERHLFAVLPLLDDARRARAGRRTRRPRRPLARSRRRTGTRPARSCRRRGHAPARQDRKRGELADELPHVDRLRDAHARRTRSRSSRSTARPARTAAARRTSSGSRRSAVSSTGPAGAGARRPRDRADQLARARTHERCPQLRLRIGEIERRARSRARRSRRRRRRASGRRRGRRAPPRAPPRPRRARASGFDADPVQRVGRHLALDVSRAQARARARARPPG